MIYSKDIVRSVCGGQTMKALQNIGLIGVPFDKGQKKYGVGIAPAALRSAGLIAELQEINGINVKDYGDVEITHICETDNTIKNMRNLAEVSMCNKHLSMKVAEVLNDDRLVLTIGGDHSIGVGTVDGHLRKNENLILIWVDAHADINTNATSGSGSVHGMPVAIFAQEYVEFWPDLPTFAWQKRTYVSIAQLTTKIPNVIEVSDKFSVKSLGYIGLRSVDPYERLAIQKFNIPCYAMENIDHIGIQKAINELLQRLDPTNSRPIHVSFDIDALDALEAPSTGTPVRGGLTLREGIQIMETIYATGRLRGLDMVEVNPVLGSDHDRKRTIEASMCVLKAGLGFDRKGSAPIGVNGLPTPEKDAKCVKPCCETTE